eukprot:75297-Chlamydomonas_euryale.AAC.10
MLPPPPPMLPPPPPATPAARLPTPGLHAAVRTPRSAGGCHSGSCRVIHASLTSAAVVSTIVGGLPCAAPNAAPSSATERACLTARMRADSLPPPSKPPPSCGATVVPAVRLIVAGTRVAPGAGTPSRLDGNTTGGQYRSSPEGESSGASPSGWSKSGGSRGAAVSSGSAHEARSGRPAALAPPSPPLMLLRRPAG